MHERRIAQDLVRTAGMTALDEGAGRVRSMKIRIGALSHLDPEALRGAVEWWSHGTIVEGAQVEVNVARDDEPDRRSTDVTLVSVDVES